MGKGTFLGLFLFFMPAAYKNYTLTTAGKLFNTQSYSDSHNKENDSNYW